MVLMLVALASGSNNARGDTVDDYVRQQMTGHRIPGAELLVIRDGKRLKEGSYGYANLELKVPVQPQSLFEIGSLTKQFTAAGILLLKQENKLALDERISEYLQVTPASWAGVTVRHLLTHTSGIKSYTGLDGFEWRRHLSQKEFIEKIGAYPLEFAPGASWKYCNTGYSLLGYIIENVSGEDYWSFMGKRIFGPLGMNSTTNRWPALVLANRVSGYEQTNHVWINRDPDVTDVFAAGAIVSTAPDLEQWLDGLDGGKILGEESKKEMWTPTVLTSGKTSDYGFGWFIGTFAGHRNVGHSGATSGFSASIQRFPENHLDVILLTNTDEQVATPIARAVACFYLNGSFTPPKQ